MCGCARKGRVTGGGSIAPGEGCPACGAELDDESREAHTCPFCGAEAALVETAPTRALGSAAEVEAALDAWTREEGLGAVRELLASSFVAATPGDLRRDCAR
jgi:hypothetical protein